MERHQAREVERDAATLRAAAPAVRRATFGFGGVTATLAPRGCVAPPPGSKLIHFIRHGEGHHNVAQREWRAAKGWDGTSEPYTMDNDPNWTYVDAELNDKGIGQAEALVAVTEPALKPELLVVSPMRRATQTGLLAFAPHIQRGALPVIAHELCHERAGRHTCDKRLAKAALAKAFPAVNYDGLGAEEDPFWGDGWTREPWEDLGTRAARFVQHVLHERPETHIAVASHSGFLLAIFNAVLECDDEGTRTWFGTGELRSVLLTPRPASRLRRPVSLPVLAAVSAAALVAGVAIGAALTRRGKL